MTTNFELDGVYVAAVTPFDEQGRLDDGGVQRLADFLLEAGVAGLVVAGTTGEYYALTDDERHALFALASEAAAGRGALIAGCNAGSTADVVRHGRRARDLGYDAVMLSAPHTSLPTQEELVRHISTVARDVGLPVVLYNFPARAGVEYGLELLDRVADIDEIVAIKEASGDFSRFLAMRRILAGRMTISCGSDDQALDYFTWGCRSWIAGTANALPSEHVTILEHAQHGDLAAAQAVHEAILPLLQEMEAGRYNQKAKLALQLQGVATGDVRPPLLPLDDPASTAFASLLDSVRRAARKEYAGVSSSRAS